MSDDEQELSRFVLTVAKHTDTKAEFDAIMEGVVYPLLSQRDSARADLAEILDAVTGDAARDAETLGCEADCSRCANEAALAKGWAAAAPSASDTARLRELTDGRYDHSWDCSSHEGSDDGCDCWKAALRAALAGTEATPDDDRCSVRADTAVPCGGIATQDGLCEYHYRAGPD